MQLGYATEAQPEQRVVTVPRDSVLLTGDNGVIYVETEPGRFEIRRVSVGPMNDNEAVIIEGLAAGRNRSHRRQLPDRLTNAACRKSILDGPNQSTEPFAGATRTTRFATGHAGWQISERL